MIKVALKILLILNFLRINEPLFHWLWNGIKIVYDFKEFEHFQIVKLIWKPNVESWFINSQICLGFREQENGMAPIGVIDNSTEISNEFKLEEKNLLDTVTTKRDGKSTHCATHPVS